MKNGYTIATEKKRPKVDAPRRDWLEHKGITYMAFFPAVLEDVDEESDDYGLVILKSVQEDGEELLSTLDSEEELTEVYELFMAELFEDEEE